MFEEGKSAKFLFPKYVYDDVSYLDKKLHGPRSVNEKSHACLACGIINYSPNTSVIFH